MTLLVDYAKQLQMCIELTEKSDYVLASYATPYKDVYICSKIIAD